MKFFQKPSTVTSPASTVKPSIAQRTKSSPEKSNVPNSASNTQTPRKAARHREQENNAPFSKCEERKQPKGTDKTKSFRRLAHDDVLQLSLQHHEVDELDLRHLSAPRAGATVDAQCPGSAKKYPAQCPNAPTHDHWRPPSKCAHH